MAAAAQERLRLPETVAGRRPKRQCRDEMASTMAVPSDVLPGSGKTAKQAGTKRQAPVQTRPGKRGKKADTATTLVKKGRGSKRTVEARPPKPMTEAERAHAAEVRKLCPPGKAVLHKHGQEPYRQHADLAVQWQLQVTRQQIQEKDASIRRFYSHVRKARVSERERVEKARQAAENGQEQKADPAGSEEDPLSDDEAADQEDSGDELAAVEPAATGNEKAGETQEQRTKNTSQRPDMVAIKAFNTERGRKGPVHMLGHVSGIDIAHRFYYRSEMMAADAHAATMGGIVYMLLPKKVAKSTGFTKVSPSIVQSGGYKDDNDQGNVITYTGSGGNDMLGEKKQLYDQKLTLGNLALVANVALGVPVRVFRKFEEHAGSEFDAHYVYDGLYMVTKWWEAVGVEGKLIYQYALQRCPGQGELLSKQVAFSTTSIKKSGSKRAAERGDTANVVCADVARGMEALPIAAVNDVDAEPAPQFLLPGEKDKPGHLRYLKECAYSGVRKPKDLPVNSDPRQAHALVRKLNGGELPYLPHNKPGKPPRLMRVRHIVYECGPWSNCPLGVNCPQALTQQGMKYRLELFKTKERGWGLRALETIPEYSFIVSYTGVLRKKSSAGSGSDSQYIFELGKRSDFTADGKYCGEDGDRDHVSVYDVDAETQGNIARFINHSCQSNTFVQPVLTTHPDTNLTTLSFFAAKNIGAFEEITLDYGNVYVNILPSCHCGTRVCINAG